MSLLPLVLGVYALLGFLVAIPFVLRGAAAVDEAADGASWGFRVLIFPGVAALWPIMLRKWLKARRGSE